MLENPYKTVMVFVRVLQCYGGIVTNDEDFVYIVKQYYRNGGSL